MATALNLENNMTYELNEQQRAQIYAVLFHWKHILFKEHNMPEVDKLLEMFENKTKTERL